MINNDEEINEKEEESSNTNEEKDKNANNDKDNIIDENERELDINECQLDLSMNSGISLDKQVDFDFSRREIISIKQFRNMLGILGQKSNNYIIERLYQTLIRITSKKYEQLSSNLTKTNFTNFLSIINGTEIHHEIFYLFFDISNKGYVTRNEFINVVSNMCESICEFVHKSPMIYKDYISKLYDHLVQINMKAAGSHDSNLQWISRSSFMSLIENDSINFYEIMNAKNFENNICLTQNQYGIIKDIMYSIKAMRQKITQKENIETKLSIITDNYLDKINNIKDEYKKIKTDINNSMNFCHNYNCTDIQTINDNSLDTFNNHKNKGDNESISKQFTFNKNKNNSNNINNNRYIRTDSNNTILNTNINMNSYKTINNCNENSYRNNIGNSSKSLMTQAMVSYDRMASPQERLFGSKNPHINEEIDEISINSEDENEQKDEEINLEFLNEEKDDSVYEIDNYSIKINQKRKKTKQNPLSKNKNKNFFFLKPFHIKNDKELEKEIKKNNIDIDNILILLKKDNFISYLNTLEECFFQEMNDINSLNDIPNTVKEAKTSIILNKPLKEKEIYEKEKSFETSLNNVNMELMIAIVLGIEKCIQALGDYELLDKNIINSALSAEDTNKTTKKIKSSVFTVKADKKFIDLQDTISNYPFKRNKYSFEEINTFHYSFYEMDKKNEKINTNKIEISEYAPQLFCNIRYIFGEITNRDFLHSFNIESLISSIFFGNINNLSELITINKDNFPEFIMFSSDTKYIIKCMTQNEFAVLLKILPNYYDHLMKCVYNNLNKNSEVRSNSVMSTYSSSGYNQTSNNIESKCTLLDAIYGIYSITLLNKKLFFVIKKNIFYSYKNLLINKKYDLKGSSIDRTSKAKISDVFKDLDYLKFEEELNLSPKDSNHLSEILEKDTLFLSNNNIINYSFYIGIAKVPDSESFGNEENEEGILSLDKNNMYYFGISDIFMEYNTGKKMEHIFKKITKGNGISTVPPNEYKKRFVDFIKKNCLK